MKKLFTLLLTLVMALALVGCQKKQIVVMINLSDGEAGSGMHAEMPENSNLKDLFDSFAGGGDFVGGVYLCTAPLGGGAGQCPLHHRCVGGSGGGV